MTVLTVAVDCDGTLVDKDQQWLPGAVEALRAMLRMGHRPIIHSCRANWPEGQATIESALITAGLLIPVWKEPGKPAADVYIDDRAVHFDGNWDALLPHLAKAASGRPPVMAGSVRRKARRTAGWS